MAHPKRRHSHSRSMQRVTHYKLTMPTLIECQQCKRKKPAHTVCPFCGYYAGKEIIKIEVKEKKKKKGR